jgi:hypothetical protein
VVCGKAGFCNKIIGIAVIRRNIKLVRLIRILFITVVNVFGENIMQVSFGSIA